MRNKILIIEDDKLIQSTIVDEFKKYKDFEILAAYSYAEAMKQFRQHRDTIDFAIVDLNLPDFDSKGIVTMVSAHHVPYIIYSGTLDNSLKELIFQKNAVDYVIKSNKNSLGYTVRKINSYLKKRDSKILIVDDSKLSREIVRQTLESINIEIIECANGEEAFNLIEKGEDNISLVITDYQMPKMDGMELCMRIRSLYHKDEIAIIAISSMDNRKSINNFLRIGANDFVLKPINKDEICIKVQSQLEILDLFQMTKDLANKDPLTGAYNRRFFFDSAHAILEKNKRKRSRLAVAMIDIDNFKVINDTYGHAIGDVAIKECVRILNENLRTSDLMARFGGEEFAVLLEEISLEDTKKLFEKIRSKIEENIITQAGLSFSYTVSIGVCYEEVSSIDSALHKSDEALYEAKESGRNRVVIVH